MPQLEFSEKETRSTPELVPAKYAGNCYSIVEKKDVNSVEPEKQEKAKVNIYVAID